MNGTLAEGVLPGLLRFVYVGRKTGLLHFTRAGERRSVRVQRGHIVHADTNVRTDRLGELLVKHNFLGQADLGKAAGTAFRDGRRLGLVLLEMGLMTRDRLEDALALHVREILIKVFSWQEGQYEFVDTEDDPPPEGEATLKVSTGELILEAVRHVQDPEAIRRGLGNLDRILVPATDPFFRFQRIALTPTDGYVLSRIDGTTSGQEVFQLIPRPAEETQRTLFGLLCVGLVEYLPPKARKAATPLPPSPSLREVTGTIGRYEIADLLGKGAMGMVYRARDTVLERDVALKLMVPATADDPELKARFEREAKAVARMTHPNIVTVFDLGTHTDGSPYIAMELLKGSDLRALVRNGPALPLDRKIGVILQVLAGLDHAHQEGIVHRDIKPANIFITTDGNVRIMDFGVARLAAASLTQTGKVMGTADYMSPEQALGHRVDGRSDLFSVGCMLYELVTGRQPYRSETQMATLYKIVHEDANFESIPIGPEYGALQPVLKKALSRNADDRYQNASEFAAALKEYMKAQGMPA